MLVLTRKIQQQIQIGDEITITVLEIKGRSVRLGIDAPREVRVLRAEVTEQLPAPESEPVEMDGRQDSREHRGAAGEERVGSGRVNRRMRLSRGDRRLLADLLNMPELAPPTRQADAFNPTRGSSPGLHDLVAARRR